ncbi:MAG: acyl carrier protein [Planctomycetes bacterium]|nr:acyl carrier protein [Planctomycetota bacterium]
MPSKEEIAATVTDVMVDALGVDEEEVTPDASLTSDLGAESIDFLDIIFRLEKAFDIKIPREELFPENLTADSQYVKDGALTEQGLAELKKRLPYADTTEFEKAPRVSAIADLFTVGMMVRYLEDKVADDA